MKLRAFLCCVCLVWAGTLAGCSATSLFKWGKDDYLHAGPKNPVTEVVSVWQPGEGTDGDGKMTRGFVGQLYFFTGNNPAPAIVDGAVRVYLFDDQGTPEEQIKPIHQFDFTPEAWQTHLGKGKLGPTYSAFIPYTRKGGHEARCTLRVRLTPKQGAPYFSEMVHIVLPGAKSKAIAQKKLDEQIESAQLPSQTSATERIPVASQHKARRPAESIQDLVAGMDHGTSEAKRPTAAPLTGAERERILREAREKLTMSQIGAAAKTSKEETEEIRIPTSKSRATSPAKSVSVDESEELSDLEK